MCTPYPTRYPCYSFRWIGTLFVVLFKSALPEGSRNCRFCMWPQRNRDFQIHEVVTSTYAHGSIDTSQSEMLQKSYKGLASVPQGPLAVSTSRNTASRTHVPNLSRTALTADATEFYMREGYACSTVAMYRAGRRIIVRVQLLPCASPPVHFANSKCRTRPATIARKLGLRENHPFRLTPGTWRKCVG